MTSLRIYAWWNNFQLQQALKRGQIQKANYFLHKLESLNLKLSWAAKLYQEKLQAETTATCYRQENVNLTKRLQLGSNLEVFLKPNFHFIEYIHQSFNFRECDRNKLQITGINQPVFDELEIALVAFLEREIEKTSEQNRKNKLQEAITDLLGLKQGIDPNYSYFFSPHIYLLKYFTDNVYCTYLAWFLVYQAALLPKNLKILDLAAGPGTVIYGLALLLSSTRNFYSLPQLQISYYSLEQQAQLQYRGLQFWRSYIESLAFSVNAYCRFNTLNIFNYPEYASKLPHQFFNFIVISHCFFYNTQQRQASHQIYRQIFQHNLQSEGYVLLIIQGRKLFNMYDALPTEDLGEETTLITMFLEELGLTLVWYKYLTSTGKRLPLKTGFGQFARENLPFQRHITGLRQKYLQESYVANYTIDDYVVLAKK
jgi:hypothetical protein